ncbi:DnaJ domain-containing protein [Gammaproteobacteria bacterium]|nr:DnaJ domain-containing protein [Gammaproteobacteria bacterium]
MIVKFEPHGFMVFMTLSMGIFYAFSHSRNELHLGKLLMALVGLSLVVAGFNAGRIIEVTLGAIIGWVYGRGGFVLPSFNWPSLQSKRTPQGRRSAQAANAQSGQQESAQRGDYQAEAERRANKAKRARERKKQKTSQQGESAGKEQAQDQQKRSESEQKQDTNQNQSGDQRQRKRVEQKADDRTPRQILGVSSSATISDMRKQYRQLSSRYHPDKYAHMSEAFRKESEEEFKKINQAWETLKKRHG